MIGYISGVVLFSDGTESILLTNSGVGYKIYFTSILAEGEQEGLYISHIIRETTQDLYGFKTFKEKKFFELLITVKGVGPKSGYSLISSLGVKSVSEAILLENKNLLKKAPGVGAKAAAQIILDLKEKVLKLHMYIEPEVHPRNASNTSILQAQENSEFSFERNHSGNILNETLMACNELGFSEEKILPLAQEILANNSIQRAEQLVHLVLKEMR